jgi:hypothetical protein
MCTPQFQQAIAGAQAAGIIPGQQTSQEEAAAAAQAGAAMGRPTNIADVIQPQHMIMQKIEKYNPPEHMRIMRENYVPYVPIQRQPTVGELLGIKPGSTQEVGSPRPF